MLSTWLALPRLTARPSLSDSFFTQIQIADVLKELQNLDPLFLKWSAEIVATPITRLFNLFHIVWDSQRLESCRGLPLFKGGDTLDPNGYRPISILPCLSTVFERQVNKQITDHFESHWTFSAMQSGFRAGNGCTSATLKVLNDIITAIDETLLSSRIHRPGQDFQLCQTHHSYLQTQQPWFLKWLPRLVHQLLLWQCSVSNRSDCCLDLWQSLWGCHRVLFSSLIHRYADDTILYTSGPSLDTVLTNLQTSHLQLVAKKVLLTVCLFYSMCNSVLLYVSNCFALSWPGRNCKLELVLNLPTWLNKGDVPRPE